MTEAAHQMTANYLPPGLRKPGSVGQGRGVQVCILDEQGKPVASPGIGEICVRGRNVIQGNLTIKPSIHCLGYYKNPKADATSFFVDPTDAQSDKWFRTGDLGYKDAKDEFVYIVGRIKEQINRGGEKISPVEIDNVLLQMPGIAEAVTFGAPDTLYGQAVEAAVVLKQPTSIKQEDILVHCKSRLASFKVPRKIHLVDAIPKSATGKVQRRNVTTYFYPSAKL